MENKNAIVRTLLRCLAFLLALVLLPALPLLAKSPPPAHLTASPKAVLSPPENGFSFTFATKRPASKTDLLPSRTTSSAPAVPAVSEPSTPPAASSAPPVSSAPAASEPAKPDAAVDLALPATYAVLDVKTGEVLQLSPLDYLIGVTAGEMPASFEAEALKAQAVAAHSYALRQMGLQQKNPDPALKGAFLSTDPAHFQSYLSPEERRKQWGEQFDTYEKKLHTAVEAVIGQVLVYDSQPIAAAFHALSSGKTESARDVWGQDLPYLLPASSPSDAKNEHLTTQVTYTAPEVSGILTAHVNGLKLAASPEKWLVLSTRSDSGAVLQAKAGGVEVSGGDLRDWFSLPSANFTCSVANKTFTFTAKGRGHGVGLSQYGANAMAQTGSDYQEILLHYYTGVSLVTLH